jgi:hypothetical protein
MRLVNGPFFLSAKPFNNAREFVAALRTYDETQIYLRQDRELSTPFSADDRGMRVGFVILDRPLNPPVHLGTMDVITKCFAIQQIPSSGTVFDQLPPSITTLDTNSDVNAVTQEHVSLLGNAGTRLTGGWLQIGIADIALLPPGPIGDAFGEPPPYAIQYDAVSIYAYYYQPNPLTARLPNPEVADASVLNFGLAKALDLVCLPSGTVPGSLPDPNPSRRPIPRNESGRPFLNRDGSPRQFVPGPRIVTFNCNDREFSGGPLGPSFVLRRAASDTIPAELDPDLLLQTVPNTAWILDQLFYAPFDGPRLN